MRPDRQKMLVTLAVAAFGIYSASFCVMHGMRLAAGAVLALVGLQLWKAPWGSLS